MRKSLLDESTISCWKKDRKRFLLIEPSLAEEQQALESSRSFSSSNSQPKQQQSELTMQHSNKPRKCSQKKQLSSLLSILFGALILCLACHGSLVLSQASLDNSTAPSNQLFETTTTEVPSTTTTTTTSLPEVASSSSDETTTGNETPLEPEPEEESPKLEQPISKLVDSVGGEAADLLVNYIKKDEDEEDLDLGKKAASMNSTEEQLRFAMETYARWRSTGDDVIELFSRKILPTLIEHGYEVDTSTIGGLLQVFNGIRSLKGWALKLLDASAKISPGILVGTQADFGDYDECLSVRSDDPSGLATPDQEVSIDPESGLPTSTLVGRYCVADVEFPKPPRKLLAERNQELNTDFAPIELRGPLFNFSESPAYKDTIFVETANFFHMLYVDPLRVGICLTNKIDPSNFEQLFNKVFEYFRVKISFKNRCVTKYDKPVWSLQQKISGWVLVTACALVLISTLLHLLHLKRNKLPLPSAWIQHQQQHLSLSSSLKRYEPLFTSFSILRNTERLFKGHQAKATHKHSSPNQSNPSIAAYSSSSGSSGSSESSPSSKRRHSSLAGSDLNLIAGQQFNRKLGQLEPEFVCRKVTTDAESSIPIENNQPVLRLNSLTCLHGVRVITMVWMIINHTYLFGGFFVLWAYRRLIDISEWPKSLSFQLVLNGWLTVETYFLLSALIIVLNVLPLLKAKKFSYFSYILHRLIRLMPAYIGLVCLNFMWPLISSGPVWMVKGRSFIQTPCENYLWTNFLFINNWIWPEKQCMVHTWFLSADFQLYLLAPIIVYFLYRRPVLGHLLNIIVAIVASVVSGLVIYANKLMPSTLINRLEFDSIKQQLSYSYFATYQHMGPYCLGIFIGYLLHNRPQVHLPKHLTWMLWILLPPLSFTTLLLTYLWNGAYNEPSLINPSPLVSAVYVAIHRTIWTSLVAWTVFACSSGRANLLSSFLSHPIFVPLSRLSFSIYLVHLPVIMFRALNLRHTIEWTDTNILWEACGNFIFSVIVGYFVNIAFESPIINLEQFLFGRSSGTSSQDTSKHSYPDKFVPLKEEAAMKKTRRANSSANNSAPQISGSKTTASSSENDSDDSKSFRLQEVKEVSSDASDEQATTRTAASDDSSHLSARHTAFRGNRVSPRWARETDQLRNDLMDYRRSSDLGDQRIQSRGEDYFQNGDEISAQHAPSSDQDTTTSQNIDSRYSDYYLNKESAPPPKNTDLHLIHNDPMVNSLRRQTNMRPSRYVTLTRSTRAYQTPGNKLDQLYPNHEGSKMLFTEPQHLLGRHFSPNSDDRGALVSRKRISLENRRQGRYNTLTGIGANEWRRQVLEEEDNWRMASNRVNNDNLNWQNGLMIPRIDSSTLKRPNIRNPTTTNSIAEETVFEERS